PPDPGHRGTGKPGCGGGHHARHHAAGADASQGNAGSDTPGGWRHRGCSTGSSSGRTRGAACRRSPAATAAVSSAATSGTEQAIAPLTAAAIAELVGGRLEGSGDTEVRRVAALDRAEAGDLSFLASRQYALQYARTRAGVVLLSAELAELKAQPGPAARVVVDEPHAALLRLLPHLYREA